MVDIFKAFKIRTYTEKEKAIARLAALGVGWCDFRKVANHGSFLPSYDTTVVDMKSTEPSCPGIAPTRTFILKCPLTHLDPLLWALLVYEVFLQPQIGVVKLGHATVHIERANRRGSIAWFAKKRWTNWLTCLGTLTPMSVPPIVPQCGQSLPAMVPFTAWSGLRSSHLQPLHIR